MATASYARLLISNSIAMAASSPWRSTELILRSQHEGFIVLRFQPGFFYLAHVTHHNDHLSGRKLMVGRRIHVKACATYLHRALHSQHQHAEAILDSEFLDRLAYPRRFFSDIDLFQAQRLGLLLQHQ